MVAYPFFLWKEHLTQMWSDNNGYSVNIYISDAGCTKGPIKTLTLQDALDPSKLHEAVLSVLEIAKGMKEDPIPYWFTTKRPEPLRIEDDYKEHDIELVVSQTGVSRDRAVKALEKYNGDIVEAIIQLVSDPDIPLPPTSNLPEPSTSSPPEVHNPSPPSPASPV